MSNAMKKDEEGYFQNLEKEVTLETIDFATNSTPIHQYKHPKQAQEEVPWKFQQIYNHHEPKKTSSTNKYAKNISFQDEQHYSNSDQEDSEGEDSRESQLQNYYRDQPVVYKKRYNFGTSWIGRREYFASTFVNPRRIEQSSLQYYNANDSQAQITSQSKEILFDSQFQSGNLHSAFKISDFQYDLILQNDINTKGNTQWFYFRIINLPKNTPLKLNIVNLRKSDSLFNYGMLPCIISLQEDRKSKRGWYRGGKDVRYFKNDHQIQNCKRYYSTLSFVLTTPHENDILKVAQCYPYSYSDLNKYLENLMKIKYKKELFERQTVANTIGRNRIDVISIKENNLRIKNRPIIFIMARQHPGETPASFICEGLIDYFLSKDKESEFMRRHYEILIIPMVNPDGVCAGNYRTNLYGFDLNRRWDGSKHKNNHEASEIKKYVSQFAKGREIAMVLDLHGHSRKLFSFFYGNRSSSQAAEIRLFPYICSKIGQNTIRFEDSTFLNEQYKRNTARVQFFNQYKILNVYTFEASFFGYYGKDRQKRHFTMQGYRQLGTILGKAIYINERGKQLHEINPDHKQIIFYRKCLTQLKFNCHLIKVGQTQNSGSQSSPEECEVKESEEVKLQKNEVYNKDASPPKPFKINKKIIKKEMIKIPIKSERQMQIIDLAQVNSIFPHNLLALIPSSFMKKKTTTTIAIQTEASQIIKIYQTCKMQDSHLLEQQKSSLFTKPQSTLLDHSSPSNLLKSTCLSRPKSESLDRKCFNSLSSNRRQPKAHQFYQTITERFHKSRSQSKSKPSKNSKTQQKASQTAMSFSCGTNTNAQLKLRLEKEIKILQYKTIDTQNLSFNAKHLCKQKSKTMDKAAEMAILQHIKLRKRNNF